MEDVHPSGTAGDGQAIPKGRYEKPGDTPENRIQCAQCGFPFNPDRDTEGDSGADNVSAGITPTNTDITISNTGDDLPLPLRDVTSFNATSRTVVDPVVTSGCPMCGTWNPRGRFRNDRSFDGGIDLTNQ